jgi:hypothetical protein
MDIHKPRSAGQQSCENNPAGPGTQQLRFLCYGRGAADPDLAAEFCALIHMKNFSACLTRRRMASLLSQGDETKFLP